MKIYKTKISKCILTFFCIGLTTGTALADTSGCLALNQIKNNWGGTLQGYINHAKVTALSLSVDPSSISSHRYKIQSWIQYDDDHKQGFMMATFYGYCYENDDGSINFNMRLGSYMVSGSRKSATDPQLIIDADLIDSTGFANNYYGNVTPNPGS